MFNVDQDVAEELQVIDIETIDKEIFKGRKKFFNQLRALYFKNLSLQVRQLNCDADWHESSSTKKRIYLYF